MSSVIIQAHWYIRLKIYNIFYQLFKADCYRFTFIFCYFFLV